MKNYNKQIIIIGQNKEMAIQGFKELSKKKKQKIIVLPSFDKFNFKSNKLIIEDFLVFEDYEKIYCFCDLTKECEMLEMLLHLTFISNRCVLKIGNKNIRKSIKNFHFTNILDTIPNLQTEKAIKKQIFEKDFIKIKYPQKIDEILKSDCIQNFFCPSNLNKNFLLIKFLDDDIGFYEKWKENFGEIHLDFNNIKQQIYNESNGINIRLIHEKCMKLTSEFIIGKYYEKCFEKLF